MIWFPVVLLFVFLYRARFVSFNEEWLGKEQALAIKGFFIVVVFLSHSNPYIGIADGSSTSAWGESLYSAVFSHTTQLMVVMFLFYSGYGVLKSFLTRPNYSDSFFKNRIIKTLFNFDLCLIPFVLLSFFEDATYPISTYVLCWIGWKEIGTNSWYIFVILCLYAFSLVGMKISFKKRSPGFITFAVTCIGSVLLICFLYAAGKQSWWYNCVLCYPLGMFFACYEKEIVSIVRNKWMTVLLVFISLALFIFFHFQESKITFMISAVLFGIIVVLWSSRVVVGNPVINWFGDHLFEIFILHRLPLTLFSRIGFSSRVLFVFTSFVASIVLAAFAKKLLKMLDNKVFRD